jgi:hypothetical protein
MRQELEKRVKTNFHQHVRAESIPSGWSTEGTPITGLHIHSKDRTGTRVRVNSYPPDFCENQPLMMIGLVVSELLLIPDHQSIPYCTVGSFNATPSYRL